ncbi:hypothetical protein [Streptomyces sp. NPDC005302]|uniref:hypothetical protein n=1 Tax=Streptomyces sp. NPDC005302 TaxID=3154675 RepID=UPI0033B8A452
MSEWRRDAEVAPKPTDGVHVRRYPPHELVRVNLYVDGDFYRGVARASYEAEDGRLAYDLLLWPGPGESPSGWYWFDESRMRRRVYAGAGGGL